MKVLPYFLVAGALTLGTACSSTNTGAGAPAGAGATTGAGSPPSGSTPTGAGSTSGSGAMGTRMGSDMNPTPAPDANSGMAPNGASTTPSGVTPMSPGGIAASGGTAATDMTAFMGTFATMPDPTFLLTAASSNLLEIQAGQLAQQQGSSAQVKQFGKMMVNQHTNSTQQLKTVATQLGVTMPQTMMPVHQTMLDQLTNKTGKGFDEAYMSMMETAHRMDVAMFQEKTKNAETPAVKTFANATLPMLRSHLGMAHSTEKKAD